MPHLTIEQIGPMIRERRGRRGIRDVAADIGISAATLSRIETGKQPDLGTFRKICLWLDIDPGEILGSGSPSKTTSTSAELPAFAHFKAEKAMSRETAHRLGELILAVQASLLTREEK